VTNDGERSLRRVEDLRYGLVASTVLGFDPRRDDVEKRQTFRLVLAIIGAFNDIAIDEPRVSNCSLRVNHFDVFQHLVVVGFRFTRGQSIRDVLVRIGHIAIHGAVVESSFIAASKDGGVVTVAGAVELRRTLIPFILVGVRVTLIEITDDCLNLQRVHDRLLEQFSSCARVRR